MTEPARSFQHYEVLRRADGTAWELGRGAMGITYKAFDVNLCCEVALKVVSSALVENPEARERFVREARAAAALRHRNVASVYHLGNDGEHFFYAMEFINGETLDALVRGGGPLSVENALRVILQVARALAAAARQHLVHRDIKPANLMVTHEDADEETVVKVIDFGLARAVATDPHAPPLTIGGFVGTPQYASPEQLEERPLDARSDFYSLGVTAWFLLTGRVPFTGSLATICQQQLTQPPPWEQLSADVPTCVRGLLGHLLAKDAARRPQNAAELRAEIETCLEKVQGTERKRPLQLPALPPGAGSQSGARAKPAGRAIQAGTLLSRRYRLLRELGGDHGIRVYQARDESETEKLVAIKVLPEALTARATRRGELAEEVRLVQAAAHPHLVQVRALELAAAPAASFLVEEWLAGFNLRDSLAGRGGALPVTEALSLLEQAAAAVDHAARCRLKWLDLALTGLHVAFPSLATSTNAEAQIRALLPKPAAEWPEWSLKIHAFRIDHDPSALDTWAGGATLVPTTGPNGEKVAGAGPSSDGQYVPALARLFHELLGGVPMAQPHRAEARPTRYAVLPALNEEGNALLRQTLTGQSEFVHGWQLHAALVQAIGGEPTRGDARSPTAPLEMVPVPVTARMPAATAMTTDPHELTHESTVASFARTGGLEREEMTTEGESVATFFQDAPRLETHEPEEFGAGSAWDRLTLVTGQRAHPGRWLAGIVGLAAVFGLVFVGVLAWLLQQTPPHEAASSAVRKRSPEPVISTPGRATTRQETPSPLAARPLATPLPSGTSGAPPENTSTSLPVTVAGAESMPPSPSPAETAIVPAASPTEERFVMVRLESIPPGAQIRLGEQVLGVTPCRVRLPTGNHQLIARYQDWPETRQTIHLDGTEVHPAAEIRLMRPDLVPGLAAQGPADPEIHARRIAGPASHRASSADEPTRTVRAAPVLPVAPTPDPSQPEVRPAQRVLTPFRLDEPADTSPPAQPSPTIRQPFSPGDGGGD